MADFIESESEDKIIHIKTELFDGEEVEDNEGEIEKSEDEMICIKPEPLDEEEQEDNESKDSLDEIIFPKPEPLDDEEEEDDEDYVALEDEDYDLIEENLGVKVQRKKKLKRIKQIEDEENDSEQAEKENCEAIANELFEGSDMDCEDDASPSAVDTGDIDLHEESEGESDDENDFIVHNDGQPITKRKKKGHIKYNDPALREAAEIFGVHLDYAQKDEFDEDMENDYEEEENLEYPRKKSEKRAKESLSNVFEPAELERNYLTDRDEEIRKADVPERFQFRDVPVTKAKDDEIDEEAEWIYKQAFSIPTISIQEGDQTGSGHQPMAGRKNSSAVGKIRESLKFIRNQNFEVPFIAFYRKEYVEPDLNIDDLWAVYKWDEKWCQLEARKMNLCHLFENMQQYQRGVVMEYPDKPLARLLANDDIYRLSKAQTFEEVEDLYAHFMLYHGHDVPLMKEALKAKAQKENNEEKQPVESTKIKHISHKYRDAICKDASIGALAKKFGLTPQQFGENLKHNCQRHKVEQYPVEPREIASHYVTKQFPAPEKCLNAAMYVIACQISREPAVRKCVRQTYFERAKISVRPTKNGIKEIDENHPCYSMKYLKYKPVKDLHGDQFLKLSMAERDAFLTIDISVDKEGENGYFNEIKRLYECHEYCKNVREWNELRHQALDLALKILYRAFQKELKLCLLNEAKEGIVKACSRKLSNWLRVAPFQVDSQVEDKVGFDTRNGTRVLSIAYSRDRNVSAFAALIKGDGDFMEFLRLPGLLFHSKDPKMKEINLKAMRDLLLKKKPHVVVVSGESREALMIAEEVKGIIADLVKREQFATITVEIIDNELGVLYSESIKGEDSFRGYPPVLRQAISNARRLQDPLMEFSQLCTSDEEILCLKYHPLQSEVDKDDLLNALCIEFINRTNEVGVDFNRALQFPHTANLVQFVCGLGPRKALYYLKTLKTANQQLENRTQLVIKYNMGPKVFINCSGFIKIDTAALVDSTETYIEVLDGSRVHPEAYEWARQMAVDALEFDGTSDDVNPAFAAEEILENPEKLKGLDLDVYAEELERRGYGNKSITLYDIRAELNHRYKDPRPPYRPPNSEEIFNMLTKEVPETFYVGKCVLVNVTGFARRKPKLDQLKNAKPVQIRGTNFWQCPLCCQNDFYDLSEVFGHFNEGDCPGQAMGVRVMLDNGIEGFIPTKMISDKHVANPEDRVKIGMTFHARITKIDIEKFTVYLTCKSSDLADKYNKWRPPKDVFYDYEAEEQDRKNRQVYLERAIAHPSFKNVSFMEAEKILASMHQGDVIIRPSSKANNHLTVTWKVSEGINQYIDVREEDKENEFSLGRKLIIGEESFEDLDEIIARHVQPMASFARDLLSFRYYTDANGGKKEEMEKLLFEKVKEVPSKIHYYVSACKDYPGKFLLSCLPRNKVLHEFITVLPEGFKFRNQVFRSVNCLITCFKDDFRNCIPDTTTAMSSHIPMGQSSYIGNTRNVTNIDHQAAQRLTTPNSLSITSSHVAGQTPGTFQSANNYTDGYSYNYVAACTPSPSVATPLVMPSYHAVPPPPSVAAPLVKPSYHAVPPPPSVAAPLVKPSYHAVPPPPCLVSTPSHVQTPQQNFSDQHH